MWLVTVLPLGIAAVLLVVTALVLRFAENRRAAEAPLKRAYFGEDWDEGSWDDGWEFNEAWLIDDWSDEEETEEDFAWDDWMEEEDAAFLTDGEEEAESSAAEVRSTPADAQETGAQETGASDDAASRRDRREVADEAVTESESALVFNDTAEEDEEEEGQVQADSSALKSFFSEFEDFANNYADFMRRYDAFYERYAEEDSSDELDAEYDRMEEELTSWDDRRSEYEDRAYELYDLELSEKAEEYVDNEIERIGEIMDYYDE